MANIVVDAGHGGFDNGASYNGRLEKTDTLALALAVGEALERMGQNVIFTRTTDVYQNPNEKARIANQSGADYFVSIHRNASPSPNTYEGVETLVYDTNGIKNEMAENINRNMETLGFDNLGVKVRKDLAVLRRTNMPAILVEAGFLNTDADNARFDANFDAIANAIAQGIVEALPAENQMADASPLASASTGPDMASYAVQVGLFRNPFNANALQKQLQMDGFDATIIPIDMYQGVVVGTYPSYAVASAAEKKLLDAGYETLIITL